MCSMELGPGGLAEGICAATHSARWLRARICHVSEFEEAGQLSARHRLDTAAGRALRFRDHAGAARKRSEGSPVASNKAGRGRERRSRLLRGGRFFGQASRDRSGSCRSVFWVLVGDLRSSDGGVPAGAQFTADLGRAARALRARGATRRLGKQSRQPCSVPAAPRARNRLAPLAKTKAGIPLDGFQR